MLGHASEVTKSPLKLSSFQAILQFISFNSAQPLGRFCEFQFSSLFGFRLRFSLIESDKRHFAHVSSFTLMLHQCIVAPLMQTVYHFIQRWGYIFIFTHLITISIIFLQYLIYCNWFPHINNRSGRHYFLLFDFSLLIFILLDFIYTYSFHHIPCFFLIVLNIH